MSPSNQIVQLYSDTFWNKWFSKVRFWDAPYLEVEKMVPRQGLIVDLGCGEGIFTNYLALSSSQRHILGIELNKARLTSANRGISNVTFKTGDATQVNWPAADAIVMFHLLHHLPSFEAQEKLIDSAFTKLKPHGKLIIVEIDKKFSVKFLITWLTDHFLVPWLFERRFYSATFFRSLSEWTKLLKKDNLSVKAIPAELGRPFTHIILRCQKR